MSGLSLLSDIAQTGHDSTSKKNESAAEANKTDTPDTSNQVAPNYLEEEATKHFISMTHV